MGDKKRFCLPEIALPLKHNGQNQIVTKTDWKSIKAVLGIIALVLGVFASGVIWAFSIQDTLKTNCTKIDTVTIKADMLREDLDDIDELTNLEQTYQTGLMEKILKIIDPVAASATIEQHNQTRSGMEEKQKKQRERRTEERKRARELKNEKP